MSDRVLLERGSHLDVFDAALAAAAGGRGRTILVEGAAGTGKTTLLEAAGVRAPGRGLLRLTARGTELEREYPYGVVRQLLAPALAALPVTERSRLLAGPVHPAAVALGTEADLDSGRQPDGFTVLNALQLLVASIASDRPLLLAVDDAHWSDASSLRALSYLAGRLRGERVVLVVSIRDDEPGAPESLLDLLREEPEATRLTTSPLGPVGVAALVRDRLPNADDEAVRAASETTGGNPLYLTELVRSVAEDHADDLAGAIRRAALPSLGDRVARRIARVDEHAPALASAMAVVGDGGSLDAAAELAGIGRDAAIPIALRLRRLEILAGEDPIAFVHPLVRRSLYDALSSAARDDGHIRAAELLSTVGGDPEAVAAHRAAVTPRGSAETARTMFDAGNAAVARGAPDEALRWYERALDEGAAEPSRAALLAALGSAEASLLDPICLDHLGEAMDTAADPALIADCAAVLAPMLFASGRWNEGADVLERAREGLGDRAPRAAAELIGIGLMASRYAVALVDRLVIDHDLLDELTRGPGWQPQALAAMRAAMAAHEGGPITAVRALVDRALEDRALINGEDRGAWATSHLLIALAEIDEYARGIEVATAIAEAAERNGSMIGQYTATGHRAFILSRQGKLAEAAALAGPQIRQSMASGNATFVAGDLFYVQDALLERSGLDDIVDTALTFDVNARGLADTCMEAMVRIVRGRLRMRELDRLGALDDLRTALGILDLLGLGPRMAPVRSLLALALPERDRAEASALVEAELAEARGLGTDRPVGLALRASGILAGNEGMPQLEESVTIFERCGAELERARSLLALGSALRRSGQPLRARATLSEAAQLAEACGADLLMQRVREESHATGARPRRTATSGPAALTSSELRVARLAAGGAANNEIASSLVVTVKTVETHLSHVYAKLGLSGRGARTRLASTLDAE